MSKAPDLLIGRYAQPGLIQARTRGQQSSHREVPGTANVSFAAYSQRHARLYAVREDDAGKIDVLSTEGGLERIAQVPSGGKQPCHCALDASESYLAVANYGSGEVSLFALDPGTGLPSRNPWRYRGAGQGPDKERQSSPHAHWVGFTPDQRWLISTDLGADRIRAFPFDCERGVVGPADDAYVAPAGSGPRWLAFLGDERALLVSELAATISLLSWRDGTFELLDCCATSPAKSEGNLGGHILIDPARQFAYVTNRGDDTIATIAIARTNLRLLDAVKSGGTSPRFLCWLDDQTLLAAHEEGGPVTAFQTLGDGRLSPHSPIFPIENAAWVMPTPAKPCRVAR
jgi:6-phosphogluconolactonase (cycloisomerase 2 family)